MTKKLPKATAQTFDDIRREQDGAQPKTKAAPSARKRRPAAATKTARQSRAEPPSPPPAAKARDDHATELRRARAGQIVERYTAYSAVGAITPIVGVDTLSVVLLIVSMIKKVAKLYGTPFNGNRVRAVAAGLIGGAGQAGVSSVVTLSLIKWVPGANLYAMAASSAASAALTRAVGQAFILHFETGGTALEFDPATLRAHFERNYAA